MKTGVIIVAAGRGARLGGETPKQYRLLAGKTVLERALACFLASPKIDAVQVVIHPDDVALYTKAVAALAADARLKTPVYGNSTRQGSVHAGVVALDNVDVVLIHDAARPFVSDTLLQNALEAGSTGDASIPGLPVTDTIKEIDDQHSVVATLSRDKLRSVQTPQVFRRSALLAAHDRAAEQGVMSFSDDGALMEWAGHRVKIFAGDAANIKLTYEADFTSAERFFREEHQMISRTGIGYDVHALGTGDHVWLGGLKIAHDQGVIAHSDGDVALHALTDAVLGTIADGDIGVHFPPSDPQWRGASSDRFLAFACERVRQRGGIIDFLDCALQCEAPKLSPHRDAMRKRIAEIAGISEAQVSVKATTMEKLGFIGRREGITAQAIATVRLPEGA